MQSWILKKGEKQTNLSTFNLQPDSWKMAVSVNLTSLMAVLAYITVWLDD